MSPGWRLIVFYWSYLTSWSTLSYSRGRRLRANGHPRTSSRNEGIKREPAATQKNKAKQNEDVKDGQLWIPPGQQVLQNGNAECPREQSCVQACEKAKRQERRAQELQGRSGKRRGHGRRKVHLGDFLSKRPWRAVLKIGQTAFEFMHAVNVEDHGSDGCPKDQMPPSRHWGGRVRVEGFS